MEMEWSPRTDKHTHKVKAAANWMQAAFNRLISKSLRETCVQQWRPVVGGDDDDDDAEQSVNSPWQRGVVCVGFEAGSETTEAGLGRAVQHDVVAQAAAQAGR